MHPIISLFAPLCLLSARLFYKFTIPLLPLFPLLYMEFLCLCACSIGRMIQHVLPKGFKRIRYYGVQAVKRHEQIKGIVREALSRIGKGVRGTVKIIGRKNYQERYRASTGQDPFVCEHCGSEMELNVIWHPKYGIIYNEIEEIMRGKYEPKEEEIIKSERDGGAVRSSPRRVQVPLFSM